MLINDFWAHFKEKNRYKKISYKKNFKFYF
jgi:hypothetical protein